MAKDSLPRYLSPVACIFGGILFGLLIAELGLRYLEWSTITNQSQLYLFRPNPNGTGSYRLRTNLSIRFRIGVSSFNLRTNSHGMPWKELSVEKPAGCYRIAFVGDSFTFGCWAQRMEDNFVGQVETLLTAKNRSLEILNFGVGGYGFDDEELLIREEVVRFSPDVIVLCSFNGNDFRDTFLGLKKYDVSQGTARYSRGAMDRVPPEFRPPDEEPADASARGHMPFWSAGSAIYRLQDKSWQAHLAAIESEPMSPFVPKLLFTEYTFWSYRPLPPVGVRAMEISLDVLGRIQQFSRDHRIGLMIVTIPFREQVYSREISGSKYDIRFPQKYVRDFALANHIPYCDLLPALRRQVTANRPSTYLAGDIHFNNIGHRIAGQVISDWLAQELPRFLSTSTAH